MVCQCRPPRDGGPGCGESCLNRLLNQECNPVSSYLILQLCRSSKAYKLTPLTPRFPSQSQLCYISLSFGKSGAQGYKRNGSRFCSSQGHYADSTSPYRGFRLSCHILCRISVHAAVSAAIRSSPRSCTLTLNRWAKSLTPFSLLSTKSKPCKYAEASSQRVIWVSLVQRRAGPKGFGLFTKQNLRAGQFVIEYVGEVSLLIWYLLCCLRRDLP